jgi:hypothetical protein
MKKRLQITLFLLLLIFNVIAQTVTKENIKADLIHIWQLSYVDYKGQHISVSTLRPESPLATYQFNADNTLIFYDGKKPTSAKAPGKWSYVENDHTINVQINGRPLGSITSISSDSMTFVIELPDLAPPYDTTKMILVPINKTNADAR